MRGVYVVLIAMLVIAPVLGAASRNTRRWIDIGLFRFQPSEFGKLLLVLFLAAFLADRGKRIDERRTTTDGASGSRSCRSCSSSCSPTSGRRSSTRRVLGACCSSRERAGGTSRVIAAARRCSRRASCGSGRRSASTSSSRTSARGSRASRTRRKDPSRPTYNINAVDHGRRRRRCDRPRSRGRDADELQLPARARDRLRVRVASPSSAGFVGVDGPAAALPARHLAGDQGRSRSRGTRFSAIAAGGIAFVLPLPDLHQRRDDDRDGADHGDPLPFVSVGG